MVTFPRSTEAGEGLIKGVRKVSEGQSTTLSDEQAYWSASPNVSGPVTLSAISHWSGEQRAIAQEPG